MKLLALLALVAGCTSGAQQPAAPAAPVEPVTQEPAPEPVKPQRAIDTGGYRLVPASTLVFKPVGPSSPGLELAGVVGDVQKGGAFFLRFAAGTKSGMHTHTADYHAIVVSGAPKHWLPGADKKAQPLGPGSYWFQPGGQPHADECTGSEPCVIYIVMGGALDVAPAPNAKPGPPGNHFLVARKDVVFKSVDQTRPDAFKLGVVSGKLEVGPVAFIVDLAPGANTGLHSHTSEYHAIVLEGAPAHWVAGGAGEDEPLAVGTYWFQPGGYDHGDRCTGGAPCRIFVMMPLAFDGKPAKKQ